MTKSITETLEFIEHVRISMESAYSHIYDLTRSVLDERPKLSKADRSHLEWGLAHMYKSKEEFLRDLERHVDTLEHERDKENNAGKTI